MNFGKAANTFLHQVGSTPERIKGFFAHYIYIEVPGAKVVYLEFLFAEVV